MSDSLEEKYRALCAAYAARLPGRLASLRAELAVAREAVARAEALEPARSEAHKLHGTAGSYGFEGVTAAFGLMEHAIDALIAAEPGASWEGIEAALRACDAAVAETVAAELSEDRTS